MKLNQKDVAYFFELETSLRRSEIRKSPEAAAALLADGFIELGSSGRVWNKSSIVESMRRDEPQDQEIVAEDFAARELAPDVVLVTYTSRTSTAQSIMHKTSQEVKQHGKATEGTHKERRTANIGGDSSQSETTRPESASRFEFEGVVRLQEAHAAVGP
jgi:hypothetical protein